MAVDGVARRRPKFQPDGPQSRAKYFFYDRDINKSAQRPVNALAVCEQNSSSSSLPSPLALTRRLATPLVQTLCHACSAKDPAQSAGLGGDGDGDGGGMLFLEWALVSSPTRHSAAHEQIPPAARRKPARDGQE